MFRQMYFRVEKKTCAKIQINNSNTEGLVHVYTDRQTNMAKSVTLWSPTFPSDAYKLRGKRNIPCSGLKANFECILYFQES